MSKGKIMAKDPRRVAAGKKAYATYEAKFLTHKQSMHILYAKARAVQEKVDSLKAENNE